MDAPQDFRALPDLAVRTVGGSVVWANDESFGERHNLLLPGPPRFDAGQFGHRGKVYDGWETRRRRDAGHDAAIIRLGLPGIVRGLVIDTAWFKGNAPAEASVEAACVTGYPSAAELTAAYPSAEQLAGAVAWTTLVPRTAIKPDSQNVFGVDSPYRWTHLRLSIYPDGGVARLRAHGEVVADPWLLDVGGADLAALEHGGRVTACSDMFYGSAANLISPGLATVMSEGWETTRRRGDGNDWVTLALAAPGIPRLAELDTTCFLHNAPGWASLRGQVAGTGGSAGEADWCPLLGRTRLQPDTRHRFLIEDAPAVGQVRLDIYPDGGMARLRLLGTPTAAGRRAAGLRW
ncbi:MAG: allantoicase, partial [Actinobacteria bacterium]|nr:allantoicase [Actinomycetota bacterium]